MLKLNFKDFLNRNLKYISKYNVKGHFKIELQGGNCTSKLRNTSSISNLMDIPKSNCKGSFKIEIKELNKSGNGLTSIV